MQLTNGAWEGILWYFEYRYMHAFVQFFNWNYNFVALYAPSATHPYRAKAIVVLARAVRQLV